MHHDRQGANSCWAMPPLRKQAARQLSSEGLRLASLPMATIPARVPMELDPSGRRSKSRSGALMLFSGSPHVDAIQRASSHNCH